VIRILLTRRNGGQAIDVVRMPNLRGSDSIPLNNINLILFGLDIARPFLFFDFCFVGIEFDLLFRIPLFTTQTKNTCR
jgi:hypothetical protein